MHVHIGFGKTPEALELLIDIQNQLRYFLPTTSPSAPAPRSGTSVIPASRVTAASSSRSARTGIPPTFKSFGSIAVTSKSWPKSDRWARTAIHRPPM
jgi:hypothetical protein